MQILSKHLITKITQVKAGDVIAFRTWDGMQYGLLKVKAITAGGSGSVTFDMKTLQ
jgi:hypothetical protein